MTNNDELAQKLKTAAEIVIQAHGDDWFERGAQVCTVHKSKISLIAAANPANILALLAERDADKKRIAELEARTVSVKLPRYDLDMSDCDSCGQDCGADMSEEPDGDYVLLTDVVERLAAAGIKLEVGE